MLGSPTNRPTLSGVRSGTARHTARHALARSANSWPRRAGQGQTADRRTDERTMPAGRAARVLGLPPSRLHVSQECQWSVRPWPPPPSVRPPSCRHSQYSAARNMQRTYVRRTCARCTFLARNAAAGGGAAGFLCGRCHDHRPSAQTRQVELGNNMARTTSTTSNTI